MGNLGQRSAYCQSYLFGFSEKMKLKCETGKLANIITFGLVPKQQNKKYRNDFCGSYSEFSDINNCTSNFLD